MGFQYAKYVDTVIEKLISVGPRILLIILFFLITYFILRVVLGKSKDLITHRLEKKSEYPTESKKRLETLYGIFYKVIFITLAAITTTIILSVLGISIGPILTTAGIFGLALSFGAQNLVRDIISGIFILYENQVRVGDVANINGTGGLVEEINLRTMILRDFNGVVHIFPNGSINTLSNMTRGWSAMVFDIGVAYKEDPDEVMDVMREVAEELRNDEVFGKDILEAIEIMGVDSFGDSAVIIRARIKTKPIKQWNIGREYRKRLKKAFDKNGIEIPFPHRSVYFGEASKPFEIMISEKKQQSRSKGKSVQK